MRNYDATSRRGIHSDTIDVRSMSTSTVDASAAAAAAAATLWLVPLWYQSMMDQSKREYRLTGVERVLCTNWQIAKIVQTLIARAYSLNLRRKCSELFLVLSSLYLLIK